jgi:hypothetical protein
VANEDNLAAWEFPYLACQLKDSRMCKDITILITWKTPKSSWSYQNWKKVEYTSALTNSSRK